ELRETPQIRYNLAESLYRLGRLVEASEHVAMLEREPELPADVKQSSIALSRRIEDELGHLTVAIDGRAPHELEVTLDGRSLPTALWDVQMPVDPGRHVVRLRRGDVDLQTEEALVTRGGSARVVLRVRSVPSPADAARSANAGSRLDADHGDGQHDG